MRQHLRETIVLIRSMGGSDITIDCDHGRHTAILFDNLQGERKRVMIQRGKPCWDAEQRTRSELRRMGLQG
ncbi:hypothetical protein [Bradyrhizobium sp.]|uniref:hypothetical protein n=1 Tax=Bradyrhizobium sp. TaxID=376 RepID=UPI0026174B4A|nr:hypothetical protein [Bradyrhizobium sp.]